MDVSMDIHIHGNPGHGILLLMTDALQSGGLNVARAKMKR